MKVIAKNVRLSFADIFKAKAFEEGGDEKFSGNFILGEDSTIIVDKKEVSLDKLRKICNKIYCEKMECKKVPKTGYDNWALNKADGSDTRKPYVDKDDEYYAGVDDDTVYLSGSKKAEDCKGGKLTVVDQLKQPVTAQDDKVYSGCYVNVVIDVYAYKSKTNKGVTASLEGIQKIADGERLGVTKIDATDDFDEVEVEDDFGDDEGEEGEGEDAEGEDFE